MANSWGHAVTPFTEEHREFAAEFDWTCAARTCEAEPTHYASYEYVTGRAGRTSIRHRRMCPAHAAKFAAKHGLRVEGGGRDV